MHGEGLRPVLYRAPGDPAADSGPETGHPWFRCASCYADLGESRDRVRERGARARSFPYSERHLQCTWYDPMLRPEKLRTSEGERVTVEDPGVWNVEAGPDFLGAVVRVNPGRRRLQGDVEIHIHPSGWTRHGHAADLRYASVRFHVTYFSALGVPSGLPPGAIQISLQAALEGRPWFSFESIDLSAYPYAARAAAPPCGALLQTWPPERKAALLTAAGQERIRRKSRWLGERLRERGTGQALYEETMAAFGFKHNKMAFRRLAERVPLDTLRAESGGDPDAAYALLAGAAGLLPGHPQPHWDRETRLRIRAWWDTWWRHAGRYAPRGRAMPTWHLAGVRPANHPLRRLMAAARLFTRVPAFETVWEQAAGQPGPEALARARESLGGLQCRYWSHRLALGGPRRDAQVALLGPSRIRALVVNLFVPYAALAAPADTAGPGDLRSLPVEDENRIVRQAANQLLGPDHPPSLHRSAVRRQGLIQIFQDYCLNDRSRCAACPLPRLLKRYARRFDG